MDALLQRIQAQAQLVRAVLVSWRWTAPLLIAVLLVTAKLLRSMHAVGGQDWMVLPVVVAAGTLSAGRQLLRQRKTWSPALADDPVLAEDANPHLLGVAGSAKAVRYVRAGELVAPYAPREIDKRLRELLQNERFVIVIGAPGAGGTRTAFEAVKTELPKYKLIRLAKPSRECTAPLAVVLGALLPLSMRRSVLWIRDIGPSVEKGEITCAALESFLRHHRGIRIVATMRSRQYYALESSDNPIDAAARDLLDRAEKVIVPSELGASELDEAQRLYPDLPRDSLRRIAAYFADYEELDRRFSLGEAAEPAGYAVARAGIDFVRCGIERPASEAFLRRAYRLYHSGSRGGRAEFSQARAWAERPVGSGRALLEPAIGAPGWRPAEGLVERVDDSGLEIPHRLWRLVAEEVAQEPGELLALGTAGAVRSEHAVARDAFERVMEIGDDGHRELAAQRLALLDEATESSAPVAALVRRAGERGAGQGLELRGPVAIERDSPASGPLFDPSVPRLLHTRAAWLYQHATLRFCARSLTLAIIDSAGILGGLAAAFAAKALVNGDSVGRILVSRWPLGLYDLSFALPLLILVGGYRDDCRRAVFHRIAIALGVAAALTGLIGASHGAGLLYTTCAWISFVFAIPLCHGLRWAYDRISQSWVRRHGLQTRTLLIGDGVCCGIVAHALQADGGHPKTFVGHLTMNAAENTEACLGTLQSLEDTVERYRVHHVVIADPSFGIDRALVLGDRCQLVGATLERVLSANEEQVYDTEFDLGAGPSLHRIRPLMLGVDVQAIKRTFDLAVTAFMLPFAASAMLAIAVLIKLDSRGPVLAPSFRPGRGGDPFRMLKFRTTEAERPLERSGLGPGLVASRDEQRVTRLGAMLRRFGLDELPQLVNVLRGEMSLVGPRPLPRRHYDRLSDAQRRRYLVAPGITGPWQVSGRTTLDYDEMARMDLRYMRTWSLAGDLEILVKTIPAALRGTIEITDAVRDP